MKVLPYLFVLLFSCFFLCACKKDSVGNDCQNLKKALISNNTAEAKLIIGYYIDRLPNKEYTAQNLNALAKSFSNDCNFKTEVLCFDCIDTLPGQSEIQIKFTNNLLVTTKVIDISYSPDNKMKCAGFHD